MYLFILSGKLFGKDIYEISFTEDINERLSNDILGYPDKNKILFKIEILFLKDVNIIKNLIYKNFSGFHMESDGDFFRIELEKAKQLLIDIVDVYDKPIKIKHKPKTIMHCFVA